MSVDGKLEKTQFLMFFETPKEGVGLQIKVLFFHNRVSILGSVVNFYDKKLI